MDVDYWKRRLFKNSFTYKGKSVRVNNWSVKIQLFGRRKTFSLSSGDQSHAAAEACRIYQTIHTEGWEAVDSRRARVAFKPQLSESNAELAPASGFGLEHWKRRLIQRRYPERIEPDAER